ncbi:MAG: polysaccharide biosynthesis protein PslH [Chloroflexota bacterium]|jgi:glycosyltransferase involved in cell wall biosynthesis|nr:polysaccharide biosynthesis protein PslH [Chloroflexota bacterium]
MRAAWVTAESPDRNLGGGNRRQAYLFEALSGVADVDLFLCGRLADEDTRRAAARVVELPAPAVAPTVSRWRRRLQTVDHVVTSRLPVEMAVMAPALPGLRANLAGSPRYDVVCVVHLGLAPLLDRDIAPRWCLDLPHLPSRAAGQTAVVMNRARDRWILSSDERKAANAERQAVADFDLVSVCSAEDGAALGSGDIAVVPNGVDLGRTSFSPLPRAPTVLLAASLNYLPNVDGAEWFCREVWPLVRAEHPAATLEIVGRAPVPRILALGALDGVRVVADVPDMAPYFGAARVAVVPLRIGSGTRLKALEAMAAGRPVVGTSVGLEGLGLADGVDARITDQAAGMAEAVGSLLKDDGMAAAMADRARTLVEQRYSWRAIGDAFATRVRDLGAPSQDRDILA